MKSFGIFILLYMVAGAPLAQPTLGTTGLLNIPTAEMQKDGTFIVGANYLPDAITPEYFNYNTGNYYFNITFLPFLEVTYKLTLLKVSQNKFNQDRSVTVRGRILKESNFWPSVVAGIDDVYSSSGSENRFFNRSYWVATKHLKWTPFLISATIGQRVDALNYQFTEGYFGGLSLSLKKLTGLKLMAEHDGDVFNAGASLLLFRHLKIQAFADDLKYWAGSIQILVAMN